MHLIYFDEVKDDKTTQKYFWVGGIVIESDLIKSTEEKLSQISEEKFGKPCLGADTEFHAADIYHRKKNYKTWNDPTKRINLIGELLRVLDTDQIKKIYVQIDREYFDQKFSTKKIDEMAFMFFCEKADALMKQSKDIGMLIGDRESRSLASKYAESLSNWRSHRTKYDFGSEIKNLIDTVHFTESHLSRLLQLADIHIWCRQFRALNHDTEEKIPKLMIQEIQSCGNALAPKKYKQYPLGC